MLTTRQYLYSEIESLASLQYIIKNKYSAVLKLEDNYVYGQDGVEEYLQTEKNNFNKSSHSEDRATISMTITINNVDQERCGHFLWDLAHKAIRDKFKFDFDNASSSSTLYGGSGQIAVDEFDAHHTIINRAFQYLSKEPREQTKKIGWYLVCWLPYHLERLRELEDEDEGALTPFDQHEIGKSLYHLFKDESVFRRHTESFAQTYWTREEIQTIRKWLMDSAVVRKLDRKWKDGVQGTISPTRGFLANLVRVIVEGFLRERNWKVSDAFGWIEEFMNTVSLAFQHFVLILTILS